MKDKAAYMVIIELPDGMTPEQAKAEIKTSVNFGSAEVALMYLAPAPIVRPEGWEWSSAPSDMEEHGGDPAPPVGDPADRLPGLVGPEGVARTDIQLDVSGTIEGEVTLDWAAGWLEQATSDSGEHAIGGPGEADTGPTVGPLNET